ncbi:hypothetical protein B0H16DRAFT_1463480 [Mycena metata]|uniref:Uncharacterized protein n=1 Tax=Mycena metata TaxID=1033252 RepID=A0AAD7IIC3_9AGAR|nr:hypothetical protein B0H16DRAFT_1463480 [Mycena metata]
MTCVHGKQRKVNDSDNESTHDTPHRPGIKPSGPPKPNLPDLPAAPQKETIPASGFRGLYSENLQDFPKSIADIKNSKSLDFVEQEFRWMFDHRTVTLNSWWRNSHNTAPMTPLGCPWAPPPTPKVNLHTAFIHTYTAPRLAVIETQEFHQCLITFAEHWNYVISNVGTERFLERFTELNSTESLRKHLESMVLSKNSIQDKHATLQTEEHVKSFNSDPTAHHGKTFSGPERHISTDTEQIVRKQELRLQLELKAPASSSKLTPAKPLQIKGAASKSTPSPLKALPPSSLLSNSLIGVSKPRASWVMMGWRVLKECPALEKPTILIVDGLIQPYQPDHGSGLPYKKGVQFNHPKQLSSFRYHMLIQPGHEDFPLFMLEDFLARQVAIHFTNTVQAVLTHTSWWTQKRVGQSRRKHRCSYWLWAVELAVDNNNSQDRPPEKRL